jgi:hypothetical protein
MNMTQATRENYDVTVYDGGELYYLSFPAGTTMTEVEVIADFMDGYDGEISEDEIEVTFATEI